MKICTKCKKEKQLVDFCKDIRHIDGLSSYCRDCHNKLCVAYKKKNPEKWLKYMRDYSKNYKAPYQENNPNYQKAISKVQKAIKNGTLIKLPCEICGNKNSLAHHPFYRYYEPLKVKWLCAKHHKSEHKKEKIFTKNNFVKIENENKKLMRIDASINFYLNYHKVPPMQAIRIRGNLLQVIRKEFGIF